MGAGPSGTVDAAARLADLQRGVSDLAARLYELDTDAAVSHLADATLGGATADALATAKPALDRLWLSFPALRDAVERLTSQASDQRRLERALAEPVDDGTGTTTSVEGLLATLRAAATEVTTTLDRLRAVWDVVLPGVANARTALAQLQAQAEPLGAADDPSLASALAALQRAEDLVASDPLVVDLAILDAAMRNAGDVVAGLVRRRDATANRLAAGEALVAQLRDLIARAHADLRLARDKVARPAGLIEPPSVDVVDGDDRSLAPWLARIDAARRRGDWRAAEAGLVRWEPVAAGHLANARRAASANAAPVGRRNELRGLLDGLRAKAAARGVVEAPAVAAAYAAARGVLYVAPCPLDLAEQGVRDYAAAIEGPSAPAPTDVVPTELALTENAPAGVEPPVTSSASEQGEVAQ